MKKYLARTIMMLVMAISFAAVAEAQFVVKIRPAGPVYRARPAAPSAGHIWVGGNYVWRGGQYIYEDGYWAMPPNRGMRWMEGHWKHRRGGWVWIPGHWKTFR
jgi:WXXGXW repeat (2 copies)